MRYTIISKIDCEARSLLKQVNKNVVVYIENAGSIKESGKTKNKEWIKFKVFKISMPALRKTRYIKINKHYIELNLIV